MKYTLLILALLVFLTANLFGQTENTAPVVWERYRHSDLEVSVNLPKLPVVIASYDMCSEEMRRSSFAYAEGVVYELVVVARVAPKVRPNGCSSPKFVFDQSTIDRRLDQLRESKGVVETKTRAADLDAYQFKLEKSVRLVIPDIGHQRWVELAVTHYPKEMPDTDRFFTSLQFDAAVGKEIGDGSKVTLGDPVSETQTTVADQSSKPAPPETKPTVEGSGSGDSQKPGPSTDKDRPVPSLLFVAKPMARYTEEARNNNVQGSVRLKVTLLANGAVGTVTPLTELKHGLTEQAINAARRLVFLPKRLNDKPVNSVINIDYSFSIY